MLRFASTAPSPAAGAVTTFFVKPHGLTSFASIDSAGCFFRRAFSAPSALSRLASDKSMPPNLRRLTGFREPVSSAQILERYTALCFAEESDDWLF
jgi:hypothetical protein